jgi:phosphogluconate dehydratase
MDRLSAAVPLLARVYPNGTADVNHFQAAGGMPYVIRELLAAGCPPRHPDGGGQGLSDYGQTAVIADDKLAWTPVGDSGDETILRPAAAPFSPDGGMRILSGNIGRACIKVSAVERERWIIEAPARVSDQSGSAGRVQGGRAGARRRRRRPFPGAQGQRHARAAR